MSRRKCCCPCTSDNCKPRRDTGNNRYDNLIVEVPTGLLDESYCTVGDRTCETIFTGDQTVTSGGGSDDWDNSSPLVHNCHCAAASDIEWLVSVNQNCVNLAGDGEPENLSCIVTVTLRAQETTGCPDPIAGAAQTWVYTGLGPIDVRSASPEFRVPYFSETLGPLPLPVVSVCLDGEYPEYVIIKESP